MKVIRIEDVSTTNYDSRPREGELNSKKILFGEPGTLGNFMLTLSDIRSDYKTPRHRHNFDQIRFCVEGTSDYARDGKLTPGTIGYFPEGTYYGPNNTPERCVHLRLAFGSASGDGWLSLQERRGIVEELKKHGEFKAGIYTTVGPDGRKKNKDGYQAVWEYATQRPLKYRTPRFQRPIFSQIDSFEWVPSPSEKGVAHKTIGIFGERGVVLACLKLDKGATATLARGNSLYFVIKGAGQAGGEVWRKHSTIYLKDHDETAAITASEPSEILHIGMPDLRGIEKAAPKVAVVLSGERAAE